MFSTPILYIIFNRLDTVKQTFTKIKSVQPKEFYIAADGPRKNKEGEAAKCEEVRNWVLSNIDWDCNVHTFFRDENVGCKYGVSGAVKWFFENVEQGIIMEDDILVSDSFFTYCEQLLNYYKNDESVGMISAYNYFGKSNNDKYDYEFITIPGVWGWASWRRVLNNYSADNCSNYSNKKNSIIRSKEAAKFFKTVAKEAAENKINTWDYQFVDYLTTNNMYTIMPCINLVSNLGFSSESTHTATPPVWYKDERYDFSAKQVRLQKKKFYCKNDIKNIETLNYEGKHFSTVLKNLMFNFLYAIYRKTLRKLIRHDKENC
nr:hypothetical protein [uncultured Treponema sp.]